MGNPTHAFQRALTAPRTPESTGATVGRGEFIHHIELDLHDWNNHELRDALARLNRECRLTPIPHGYENLALVIRVDQPDQVAEDDSMFVSES